MDLTDSIAPRSDQLNAEDLLSGPRTVTVVDVTPGSAEQPVNIITAEFGPDRPLKPSKTVRRILVAAWGKEASTYKGRRMTLYRDPTVRFGGMEVGGIRVSHLSHIDKPLSVALTVTRGRRAPFVVQPLADEPARLTEQQLADIVAGFDQLEVEKPQRIRYCSDVAGRSLRTATDLTAAEADLVLASIRKDLDQ